MSPRRVFMRLGGVASIAVAVWLLAAGVGGYQLLSAARGQLVADRGAEDAHRNSAWSPIYSFADVCQSKLLPTAGVLLVDPTGAPADVPASLRTGPAAFGLPGDLDWSNQAVFAYVLYPRTVSALGHVPPGWSGVGAASYIAIWEQRSLRSQATTAAAQQAEAALGSSPGALEVCTYSTANGDRGVIFRTPGTDLPDAASAPAPPPLPGGRIAAYARVLLGLVSLWLLGFLIVRLIARGALSPLLSSAIALPLGCLGASLQLIAYSSFGVGWSGPALAVPWLGASAVVLWRDRAAGLNWLRKISRHAVTEAWRGLGTVEKLALVVLAGLGLLITLTAPLGLPWSDGFNLYYFKARAFFNDGSVIPYYQHAGGMLFSFPAHPPLVPLSVTWLYLFLGEADEHASLLLWPALYLSMLGGFYALVRMILARSATLWYTVALTLVGYVLSTQAMVASFADLPLSIYLLLACGLLCFWVKTQRKSISQLVLAGLFLGAATLTKEEGLLAALVVLAATPLLMGRQMNQGLPSWWLPGVVAFPIVAVIAGSWLWLRMVYGLPELTVHLGGSMSVVLHRLPPALIGMGVRALLPLLPFLALAAAVTMMRSQLEWRSLLSARFWFLLAIVIVQLGFDVAAIAAAPVEVHHQVAIAAGRLVSQVLPLVFLGFAEVWAAVFERARIRVFSLVEGSPWSAAAPYPTWNKGT